MLVLEISVLGTGDDDYDGANWQHSSLTVVMWKWRETTVMMMLMMRDLVTLAGGIEGSDANNCE